MKKEIKWEETEVALFYHGQEKAVELRETISRINREIGESIRTRREKVGMARPGLADLMGLTARQLESREWGKTAWNLDEIKKAIKAINDVGDP